MPTTGAAALRDSTISIPQLEAANKGALNLDLMDREVRALREIITTRLNSMDKASDVLAENVNRVPTLLDREILRVSQLFDEKYASLGEKFAGIDTQFKERDIRADKTEIAQKEMAIAQATSASTAVAAALQAQKEAAAAQNASNSEAITKSELSVSEQLKGIQALLASINNALNDKITVINGRLDRGEGGHVQKDAGQASFLGIAGLVVAVAAVVLVGVGLMVENKSTTPQYPPYYPPQQQPAVTIAPAAIAPH